ncbi:hypothetical protein ERJ75_001227300 [Trypanosoma vivax]|nr:hypothetical protein TRVL_02872 [Trypanosoma vivax]KAH8609032.1 hypothetical protein ERJ75_001227300 [Trypanosoma vivax]
MPQRCSSESLEHQLAAMLHEQLAIEERVAQQGQLMRRITHNFSLLRDWGARKIYRNFSLHDLLILSAYLEHPGTAGEEATTRVDQVAGEGEMEHAQCAPHVVDNAYAEERWSFPALELLEEAKNTYAMFVRGRVLEECSDSSDCVKQFNTLTAASFYLLLPHLVDILDDLVSAPFLQTGGEAVAYTLDARLPDSKPNAEWCTSLARVFSFVELGLQHFPEVVCRSDLLPRLRERLYKLQQERNLLISATKTNDTGNGEAVPERVAKLCDRSVALLDDVRRAEMCAAEDDIDSCLAH